jgi:pimeloyl-ACP methyl ester carboxylesterase
LGGFEENAAELRAALAALKARFGAHVASGPILLIGYGEGAAMAADLSRQEPAFFARLALLRGDPSSVSSIGAKTFAERGGKRMLFFCESTECRDAGAERALWLTRRGVAAKSVRASVGPYFDRAFADALSREIPWLVEGDARWAKPRR